MAGDSLISIFTNSGKEEMRCSRNRKALLDNIIKHCNISCQRRLWNLLPWNSLRAREIPTWNPARKRVRGMPLGGTERGTKRGLQQGLAAVNQLDRSQLYGLASPRVCRDRFPPAWPDSPKVPRELDSMLPLHFTCFFFL